MTLLPSSSLTANKAGSWVDEDRSQSEPLPPVNEHDTRPAVRDLIAQNADTIATIRKTLTEEAPLYDPIKHDDLWILRYVLSHKTAEKAMPAAKQYLVYRHKLGLDEKDIRDCPPGPNCSVEGVRMWYNNGCKGVDAMQFSQPDPNRGVFMMIQLASLDQNKIAEITDEDWPFWYFMEWMFQCLDSVTRRTGRLTKGVRFIDLQGYSTSMNNKECISRNSKNAQECQDHYPQMLASVYVLNAPTWSQMVFRMLKPLLPKRFVEKFVIINGPMIKKAAKTSAAAAVIKDSTGILKHMSVSHLPSKFGGDYKQWPYPSNISTV
jgi:hypothetical protein